MDVQHKKNEAIFLMWDNNNFTSIFLLNCWRPKMKLKIDYD